MNIVFMGTPDFAVPPLQILIDEGHEISLVVTQPDRPKGRGKKDNMSAVKELALKYDLPVNQPERVKNDEEFYKHIKALNPDLIIVVAFGQILPESILEIPRLGCINIHGSLLPKYRGAGPIQWSVINQEEVSGVTIMYMDKGMDTGDMLYKKEIALAPKETSETLYDKMRIIGADALKEAMPLIISGGVGREKQDDTKATYAPPISKSLGEVDFSKSAKEIDALIRGLNPWPVAYTYYDNQCMKVWDVDVIAENSTYASGTIVKVAKEGLYVQTGEGQLCISEIQVPNKKRMAVSEYIKGHTILEGQILGR
ncbi:MAG: methionyl-tRNA formyltransferase [Cellulosilyticaceae bacterium]